MPNPDALPQQASIDLPPPSTAVSEPMPNTQQASRPNTRRRPRTGAARRPATARPDTSASGIGELPDQEFFPEGEAFDGEEEFISDFDEEEEAAEPTFAFHRPQTAAVPVVAFSESDPSAPNTGIGPGPTTAGTGATGYQSSAGHGLRSVLSGTSASPETRSTGPVEIGTYFEPPVYDPRYPPPLSGRNNPNNSAFAFSVNRRHSRDSAVTGTSAQPGTSSAMPTSHGTGTGNGSTETPAPSTGRSLFDRLQRKSLTTASTAMTGTTDMTHTTNLSVDSMVTDDMASMSSYGGRPKPRKTRSKAPLIDGHGSEFSSSDVGSRRGVSRGSYGLTEMTGDMTVPDGMTTWGDGARGRPLEVTKDGSEEGSIGAGLDFDLLEEDSPYPEVRASVSNIDDPEMPGTLASFSISKVRDMKLTPWQHSLYDPSSSVSSLSSSPVVSTRSSCSASRHPPSTR